jgi:glycosyl transferase family 25
MKLFENTLYINLNERIDRNEHVISELEKIGIKGQRISAIKMDNGAIGCSMSHIKCLELAIENQYEYVFICEDDIEFTNPTIFLENINKFYDNKNIDWDVLIIGGNNAPPYEEIHDYCARIFNCQTTTGYIVNKNYYSVLLNNFKQGLSNFIPIDFFWKELQKSDNWFILTPITVTQYINYSDIEKKVVDYRSELLKLDGH